MNLERFFERVGWSLKVTQNPSCYLPGDIVTCLIGGDLPHVMVVSDKKSQDGTPLVIHNVGEGTQEEDRLFAYDITGHHRVPQGATAGFMTNSTIVAVMDDADMVSGLELLPIDGYWEEFKAAAVEDEKDGYHPRVSYPGHSGVGSISIMERDWRPDTSKYGPRLKACVEKWRLTIEHNFTVGEKRRKALQSLCEAVREQRPQLAEDEFAILLSNVVERAHLSPKEVDMVFPKGGGRQP